MKRLLYFIPVLALLAACQQKNGEGEVAWLHAERDSLKSKYDEIGKRLAEIDVQLTKLDTTIQKRVFLVSARTLQPDTFEHYFEVQGLVEADKSVTITSETGGDVKQVLVEEGAQVQAGQTLVVLDSDILRSRASEVEAQYDLANTVYEKQKKLWDQGIGSEIQYLQAKTNMESLAKARNTIREQIQKSVIKAPYNGVVDDVFVKEGELSMPGFPVLRLVNTSQSYLVADVSERYVEDLKKGNHALVNFSMVNDNWYEGKVRSVGKYINPDNRTFRIQVDIPRADFEMKPNMLSAVRILDFKSDSALVVPSSALMQDAEGKNYLFVVNNGHAKKIYVQTGLTYQGDTHVKQGLHPGEQVVLAGARTLKDGDQLEVRNDHE
ncbi:MAG: efflux RND transporter periplasmic adaptor subunit [Flavobacteriales bacterium]|nr:efflux RND transporter periplasmic adaptor subunit [Flavobacteriales bacterium]